MENPTPMPASAGGSRNPLDPPLRTTPSERAWEEYLEGLLAGRPEDLDAFCARHPEAGPEVRRRLEAFRRMLAPPSSGGGTAGLTSEPALPFERLGDFRLLRRLGEGGMGVVYLARQESLGRLVALKIVRPERMGNPEAAARFEREAKSVARLRHPNIITVFATGEEGGVLYLAMELVPGRSLEDVLREEGGEEIPIPARVRWIAGIARALDCVHRAGLIHRDVKPSNIRITPEGLALLVDFGLARPANARGLTLSGEFRGTPCYASPEQVAGKGLPIGPATDLYSLGCTLYEAVTGSVPFRAESTAQLFGQILAKDPPSPRRTNPSISRDLETVILKALEKDPGRRYRTAEEFAEDLDALLEIRPIRARPSGPATRFARWIRRRPEPALAVGAILAAVGFAGISAFVSRRSEERAFQSDLAAAEGSLEKGDFEGALAAIDHALGKRPADPEATRRRDEVVQARRREGARRALGEARRALEDYGRLRAELGPIHRRIEELRARAESSRLSPGEREDLQGDLARLRRISAESEEQGLTILEALKRAARDDPEDPEVRAAFAGLYLEKWREAHAAGDRVAEEMYRGKVVEFDGRGAFREEIEGGGTLAVDGAPPGAEAFLFRYEPQAAVRAGGETRLVPVPFHPSRGLLRGGGEGKEDPSSPGPGSVVLRVERVAPGSKAENSGIRPEELVLSVAGVEVEEAVFAVHPQPNGPAAQAGVRSFDRIARIAGQRVQGEHTVEQAYEDLPAGESFKVVFQRGGAELRVAATKSGSGLAADLGISLLPAEAALQADPFPVDFVEVCWWSQGRVLKTSFPGPEPIGVRLARTAYPLLLSPENSVGFLPVPPLRVPPGSYLLVLRHWAYETLRQPVLLRRGEDVRVRVEMLGAGTTPEGFVWIPPGPFLSGGGLGAIGSVEESVRETNGFWISRDEVTVREYAEFLNDPSVLAEVKESGERGAVVRVPRGEDLPGGTWRLEGDRYVHPQDPRWPVLGVSWEDADAYCRWRTSRERTGDRGRVYDLPTEEEWCKAARGVDGRDFPWGSEFDWSFCLGGWFPPESKHPEPVGRHVRGASVWEVMDVEAGAREWCSGWTDEGRTHHPSRGASWAHRSPLAFHVEHRFGSPPSEATRYTGFRVVLRPNPTTPPR